MGLKQAFSREKYALLAFTAYLALILAITYPLALNMHTSLYGYLGDPVERVSSIYYVMDNVSRGEQPGYTSLLNAPFGAVYSSGYFEPFHLWILVPLASATSILFSRNIFILLGPLLTATAMFFLARKLTKSSLSGFIAGLLFGFSPFVLSRNFSNMQLSQAFVLPLFIMALLNFWKKKSIKNAFLLGFALFLVGFFDHLFLFLTGFVLCFLYAFKILHERKTWFQIFFAALKSRQLFLKEAKPYAVAIIVFLLFYWAFALPSVLTILQQGETTGHRALFGARTNMMNTVFTAIYPVSYVTPSVYNPIFGKFTTPFVLEGLAGTSFVTVSVFLGFTALTLALKSILKRRNDFHVNLFLFAAICCFIFATGSFMRYILILGLPIAVTPLLLAFYSRYKNRMRWTYFFAGITLVLILLPLTYPLLEGWQGQLAAISNIEQIATSDIGTVIEKMQGYEMFPIPMPSFFTFRLISFVRSYNLFSVYLMMCVALLAGIGFKEIYSRLSGNRKALFALLVTALILIEFINVPPSRVLDVSQTPPEYEWLASQEGSFIIAEYPLGWTEYYMLFQPRHNKPIANGRYSSQFSKMVPSLRDLSNQETLQFLSGMGVRYAITHDTAFLDELMKEDFPDNIVQRRFYLNDKTLPLTQAFDASYNDSFEGIELVKRFEHATIYEITAEPKEFDFEEAAGH